MHTTTTFKPLAVVGLVTDTLPIAGADLIQQAFVDCGPGVRRPTRHGDSYDFMSVAQAWKCYQAGHASALADDERAEQFRKGWTAGHAAGADPYIGLLDLVARIRAAAGDPEGKLMQDELVAHIAGLRVEHEQAMDVLRQIAAMPRRTREQRLASACAQFLDAIRAEPKEPS